MYGFIVKVSHVYLVLVIQSKVSKILVSICLNTTILSTIFFSKDVHITNNAVQKTAPNYDPDKGKKEFSPSQIYLP